MEKIIERNVPIAEENVTLGVFADFLNAYGS